MGAREYMTAVASQESIQYVNRGEQRVFRTFIGGLLWNIAWFGVPLCILVGYYAAVIRHSNRIGTDSPPEFTIENAFEMGVDGLKTLTVLLTYFITPIVLFYMLLATNAVTHGMFAVSDWAVPELLGVTVLTLFSYSVIVYVTPGIVIRVADTQLIRSGFNLKYLSSLWTSKTYFVTVTVFMLKSILVGWVLIALPIITLGVGAVLYPFVVFVYFMHVSREFGQLKMRLESPKDN